MHPPLAPPEVGGALRKTHGVSSPLVRSQVFNSPERGWDSVGVDDSDVVACLGFLPERHVGAGGETPDWDAGVGGDSQDGDTGVELDAQSGDVGVASDGLDEGAAVVGCGGPVWLPRTAACGGTSAKRRAEFLTNEPKLDHDVITIQSDEIVEVVANSDGSSGLDKLRANPRPAGGKEGEEDAKSEAEVLNSKFEGDRELGDIGHEGQPLDAERADTPPGPTTLRGDVPLSAAEGSAAKSGSFPLRR